MNWNKARFEIHNWNSINPTATGRVNIAKHCSFPTLFIFEKTDATQRVKKIDILDIGMCGFYILWTFYPTSLAFL